MFSDFGRMLARGPSGQVFGVLGGEGARAMRPPDPGVVDAPGLARDGRSIVMIEGSPATCPAGEGSGFVFASPARARRTRTWWPRRPALW